MTTYLEAGVLQAEFLFKRAEAEASLRSFVEQAWDVLEPGTRFIPGLHVDAVYEHLQALMEGKIKDLIINIRRAREDSSPAWRTAWVECGRARPCCTE